MALTDSLISFWELEEASGTRADAVVASANDLTDNNTVTQNTGKVGSCGQWTRANNESLTRASNASLETGDIDFSLNLWVYPDTSFNAAMVSKTDLSLIEYDLYVVALTPHWYIEAAATSKDIAWGSALSTATWYMVTVWHDSVNNLVGIAVNDGTPVTSSYSGGARVAASTLAFRLGTDENSTPGGWNGRIDQTGFWKKVLSAAEITQLYNGGAGLSYAAMQPASRRLILSSPLG